jgi:DNA-binding transcriptional LysR family regulator
VHFTPRLIVNSIRGAIAAAVSGRGVTRLMSYHVAEQVREGSLEIVLKDHDDEPLPLHVISPQGRLSVPKVRAFVDLAFPRLRSHFAHASRDTEFVRKSDSLTL